MGVILSRFRKKKSSVEVLESLENEIKNIEEYGQTTERQHKAVVGRLLLFSVGLYVLAACLFYFFFFPASLYDQLLYVIPLLLFPLIIVFVKRLVSWWYRRKLSRNQEKLIDIRKQKKELLEQVMDKETYKVARQILEKFAPDQLRKTNTSPSASSAVNSRNNLDPSKSLQQLPLALPHKNAALGTSISTPGTELRRRIVSYPLASTPGVGARQSGPTFVSPRLTPGAFTSGTMPPTSATVGATAAAVAAAAAAAATATTTAATTITTTTTTATTIADTLSVAAAGDAGFAATGTTISPTIDDSDEEDIEDEDENQDLAISPSVAGVNGGNGEKCTEEGIRKGSVLGLPSSQPVQLFRPVLPRERTVMDRLVEYIVGDGLNQRYALICRGCGSHNGMALKEEFEYLSFRCCYCFHWNPARKQRLQAPRIDELPSSGNTTTSSSARESNTEEEEEPSSKSKEAVVQQDTKESKSEPYDHSSSVSSSEETSVTLTDDTKESKSEQYVSKAPTSSSDGNHVTLAGEFADSPSSTETEFESLVPDHSLLTQQLLELQKLCSSTNLPSSH